MHLPLKCLTRTNEVRSYINKCFSVLLLENSLIIMQTIGKNENKNKNKTAVKEQKVKTKKKGSTENTKIINVSKDICKRNKLRQSKI